ncbi:hypothetical protein CLF_111077 [Clonorchis sinensis]|uniref:Uncharacterized protein n=1 Tax=Clonorchis sinensis TaxID=79923 RepID=G7YLE2_CLOSI|nr:hypothetical protein CLF_111077 [Clonorchis sinensis]
MATDEVDLGHSSVRTPDRDILRFLCELCLDAGLPSCALNLALQLHSVARQERHEFPDTDSNGIEWMQTKSHETPLLSSYVSVDPTPVGLSAELWTRIVKTCPQVSPLLAVVPDADAPPDCCSYGENGSAACGEHKGVSVLCTAKYCFTKDTVVTEMSLLEGIARIRPEKHAYFQHDFSTKYADLHSLDNLAVPQSSCVPRVAWQLGTERVLQLNSCYLDLDPIRHGITCRICNISRPHRKIRFTFETVYGAISNSLNAKSTFFHVRYVLFVVFTEFFGHNYWDLSGNHSHEPRLTVGLSAADYVTQSNIIVNARERAKRIYEKTCYSHASSVVSTVTRVAPLSLLVVDQVAVDLFAEVDKCAPMMSLRMVTKRLQFSYQPTTDASEAWLESDGVSVIVTRRCKKWRLIDVNGVHVVNFFPDCMIGRLEFYELGRLVPLHGYPSSESRVCYVHGRSRLSATYVRRSMWFPEGKNPKSCGRSEKLSLKEPVSGGSHDGNWVIEGSWWCKQNMRLTKTHLMSRKNGCGFSKKLITLLFSHSRPDDTVSQPCRFVRCTLLMMMIPNQDEMAV